MVLKLLVILTCIGLRPNTAQDLYHDVLNAGYQPQHHNSFVEYEMAHGTFYKITLVDADIAPDYQVRSTTKWCIYYTPPKSEYRRLIGFLYVKYAYSVIDAWGQFNNAAYQRWDLIDIDTEVSYKKIKYLRNPYEEWRCRLVSRDYKYREDWLSFGEAVRNLLNYELGYKNPKLERQIKQLFPKKEPV